MICEKIRGFMDNEGIKQNSISKKTGIPENTLSNMLNGKRKITAEEYCKICDALGVPLEKFAPYQRSMRR